MVRNVSLNSEVKGVCIQQYYASLSLLHKTVGNSQFQHFFFYIIPIYMGPTNCLIFFFLLQGNLNTKERN